MATSKPRTWVWAQTEFEALHRWPDAPFEVNFLRAAHRHMFHLKVEIEVDHADRAVEFILLKRFVTGWTMTLPEDLLSKSCEMIAEDLYPHLAAKYGYDRGYRISVSEDGENGATLEWEAAQ